MADIPQLFRLNIEVADLPQAQAFYETLLGLQGRALPGSRFYMNAGPVTLQVVDVAAFGGAPHPAAKALYFSVADLDAIHGRAVSLNALSTETVHGVPGGDIDVKPWG